MKHLPEFRLSRRTFLKSAFSAIIPFMSTRNTSFAGVENSGNLYISGARQSADQYVAVVFNEKAQLQATVPLTSRAHGAAAHVKSNRACIFGRRPGYFMNTFDIRTPQNQNVINPIEGRHFYGHGAYSENGKLLYATENDFDKMRGVVGIYDATSNYRRIGELDAFGVGPHEIVRVPGTALLVIANGGIQTHPDSGREKLNIGTMQPSLSIVDLNSGKLVGRHVLADDLHQVSIRHLACSDDRELWYAGQYEGDNPSITGLVGRISVTESLESFGSSESKRGLTIIDLPEKIRNRTSHYLSSVAIAGQHAMFTSAKGGVVFTVNRVSLQVDDSLSILDCSGVCEAPFSESYSGDSRASGARALITCGTGEVVRVSDGGLTTLAMHNLQWDNHVYRL